jgi:hypothetical protein
VNDDQEKHPQKLQGRIQASLPSDLNPALQLTTVIGTESSSIKKLLQAIGPTAHPAAPDGEGVGRFFVSTATDAGPRSFRVPPRLQQGVGRMNVRASLRLAHREKHREVAGLDSGEPTFRIPDPALQLAHCSRHGIAVDQEIASGRRSPPRGNGRSRSRSLERTTPTEDSRVHTPEVAWFKSRSCHHDEKRGPADGERTPPPRYPPEALEGHPPSRIRRPIDPMLEVRSHVGRTASDSSGCWLGRRTRHRRSSGRGRTSGMLDLFQPRRGQHPQHQVQQHLRMVTAGRRGGAGQISSAIVADRAPGGATCQSRAKRRDPAGGGISFSEALLVTYHPELQELRGDDVDRAYFELRDRSTSLRRQVNLVAHKSLRDDGRGSGWSASTDITPVMSMRVEGPGASRIPKISTNGADAICMPGDSPVPTAR